MKCRRLLTAAWQPARPGDRGWAATPQPRARGMPLGRSQTSRRDNAGEIRCGSVHRPGGQGGQRGAGWGNSYLVHRAAVPASPAGPTTCSCSCPSPRRRITSPPKPERAAASQANAARSPEPAGHKPGGWQASNSASELRENNRSVWSKVSPGHMHGQQASAKARSWALAPA